MTLREQLEAWLEWCDRDKEDMGGGKYLTPTEVRDMLKTEPTPATGDEYHTMDELYAYRMAYHAHSAQGWMLAGVPVVKSWKHSDGEPCFGGGWFIVSAQLATGQVTNHYKAEHWDLFNVPAVDLPPVYDGHTPADALDRLSRCLGVRDD